MMVVGLLQIGNNAISTVRGEEGRGVERKGEEMRRGDSRAEQNRREGRKALGRGWAINRDHNDGDIGLTCWPWQKPQVIGDVVGILWLMNNLTEELCECPDALHDRSPFNTPPPVLLSLLPSFLPPSSSTAALFFPVSSFPQFDHWDFPQFPAWPTRACRISSLSFR